MRQDCRVGLLMQLDFRRALSSSKFFRRSLISPRILEHFPNIADMNFSCVVLVAIPCQGARFFAQASGNLGKDFCTESPEIPAIQIASSA